MTQSLQRTISTVLHAIYWYSLPGMLALCRALPMSCDWKAELKWPSPGPLEKQEKKMLSPSGSSE